MTACCGNCRHFERREPGTELLYIGGDRAVRSDGWCRLPRVGEGKDSRRNALSENWCDRHKQAETTTA